MQKMFFKELRLLDIVFLPFESKKRYGNLQVLPGRHATPCPARGAYTNIYGSKVHWQSKIWKLVLIRW